MKEDAIQVLKVEPGKAQKVVTIPNTLKAMQQMVGGYIEVIPMEDVCLVCNEEGKLMGLPGSRRLGDDIIAGTFFLARDTLDGGFCSLTQEQIDRWGRHFAQPESFQPDEVERKIHIEFYTM